MLRCSTGWDLTGGLDNSLVNICCGRNFLKVLCPAKVSLILNEKCLVSLMKTWHNLLIGEKHPSYILKQLLDQCRPFNNDLIMGVLQLIDVSTGPRLTLSVSVAS